MAPSKTDLRAILKEGSHKFTTGVGIQLSPIQSSRAAINTGDNKEERQCRCAASRVSSLH